MNRRKSRRPRRPRGHPAWRGLAGFACGMMLMLGSAGAQMAPRVFLLHRQSLMGLRARLCRQPWSPALAAFLDQLRKQARRAMHAGLFSVMDKSYIPPSGNKHDYMSWAPYFWPNPRTSHGLPYIRRDGLRNPQIKKITDHDELHRLIPAVETLALAYFLMRRQRYASHAAHLIRVWFLDPATYMKPNLNYAQGIPGRVTGRGIGVIDTAGFPHLIDALGLLAGSPAWTPADQAGMVRWFTHYLHWLLTSRNGRAEQAAKNNHGTWYDVQAADEALFTSQPGLARRILVRARRRRIARQIAANGREPLETVRTQSFQYSMMNLRGLCELVRLGHFAGVDLWRYRSPQGAGIVTALDYLLPYALGGKRWPYHEITRWSPRGLRPMLWAAVRHDRSRSAALLAALRQIGFTPKEKIWLNLGWQN